MGWQWWLQWDGFISWDNENCVGAFAGGLTNLSFQRTNSCIWSELYISGCCVNVTESHLNELWRVPFFFFFFGKLSLFLDALQNHSRFSHIHFTVSVVSQGSAGFWSPLQNKHHSLSHSDQRVILASPSSLNWMFLDCLTGVEAVNLQCCSLTYNVAQEKI